MEGKKMRSEISFRQVARAVPGSVHINTVRRWATKGVKGRKLNAHRVGGRWYTTTDDLEEFLRPPSESMSKTIQLTESQKSATEEILKLLN